MHALIYRQPLISHFESLKVWDFDDVRIKEYLKQQFHNNGHFQLRESDYRVHFYAYFGFLKINLTSRIWISHLSSSWQNKAIPAIALPITWNTCVTIRLSMRCIDTMTSISFGIGQTVIIQTFNIICITLYVSIITCNVPCIICNVNVIGCNICSIDNNPNEFPQPSSAG